MISVIATMFGWLMRFTACASANRRLPMPGSVESVWAIFIAARRRMATCSTSNTRLVVPSPSLRMRRYGPIVRPGSRSIE